LSLKWYDYKSLQSEQLKNEQKAIFDIFSNIKIFNNIKGIAVYVNNEIAGFAIGEKLNSKMATVHFEKGNYNFSGIYPFLNKSLVEIFFRDVEFINLQEDLGLEGLRRAKSAYQPKMDYLKGPWTAPKIVMSLSVPLFSLCFLRQHGKETGNCF